MMRSASPELQECSEPDQFDAWVELAEPTQDPEFRAAVRWMAEHQAAERPQGDTTGLHHDLTPDSPRPGRPRSHRPLRPVFDRADDAELCRWLLAHLHAWRSPTIPARDAIGTLWPS